MSTKVLLIESNSPKLHFIENEFSNFEVYRFACDEQAKIHAFLLRNSVDAIIHFIEPQKSCIAISHLIHNKFPRIAYLQLFHDKDMMLSFKHKSGLNKKLLYGPQKHELIFKNLKKLLWLSKVQKKLYQNEQMAFLLRRWQQMYVSPGVEEFIETANKFISSELNAENVIWFSNEDLEYYGNELWKVHGLTEANDRRSRPGFSKNVFAYKYIQVQEVSKLLKSVVEHSQQNINHCSDCIWFYDKNLETEFVLIPMLNSKRVDGHFLVLNPKNWYHPEDAEIYENFMQSLGHSYVMAEEYSKVRHLSYVDDLTNLYNQRFLPVALDKAIERSDKYTRPFSVLFMDIDHFKKVNDSKGHMVGSKILVELGHIVRQNIRSLDYGFRYGGDEYLVILTDTDPETAKIVAERIRKQVEDSIFEVFDKKIQITLSIGIATYPYHAKTREEVIELADQAMYYGKNKSRNIVFIAS